MKRGDIGFFKFKVYDSYNLMLERIGIICGVSKYCVFIFAIDGKLYRVNRKHILIAEPTDVPAEAAKMLENYAELYKQKEELEKPLRLIERRMELFDKASLEKSMGILSKEEFLDAFLSYIPEEIRNMIGKMPYEDGEYKDFVVMLNEVDGNIILLSSKGFFFPYNECSFFKKNGNLYAFKPTYKTNSDYIRLLEENQPLLPIKKKAEIGMRKGGSLDEFITTAKYTVALSGEPYTKKYARKLAKQLK